MFNFGNQLLFECQRWVQEWDKCLSYIIIIIIIDPLHCHNVEPGTW